MRHVGKKDHSPLWRLCDKQQSRAHESGSAIDVAAIRFDGRAKKMRKDSQRECADEMSKSPLLSTTVDVQ